MLNKPLVEPTARVPPSDMKSTEVRGDSAVITFTDLNKNKEKLNTNQLKKPNQMTASHHTRENTNHIHVYTMLSSYW